MCDRLIDMPCGVLSTWIKCMSLTACLLGAGLSAMAQLEPTSPIPSEDLDFYNRNNLAIDTTGADSFGSGGNNRPQIKPNTKLIDRKRFWIGAPTYRTPSRLPLDQVIYWDDLDTLPGFTQSLGQLGLPYQTCEYGLKERYMLKDLWEDPFFRKYNRYIIDARQQAKYYDTKTPYVDVYLTLGPNRLQSTGVTVSQNISPQWNMSGHFKRRLSESVYRNVITDHVNTYINTNYRAKNERYYAFGTVAYHQLNDAYNGGVPRSITDGQLVDDGTLIQEQSIILSAGFANNFFKEFNAPLLSDALSSFRLTQIYTDHYLRLWDSQDTLNRPNRITLRVEGLAEFVGDRYADNGISVSTFAAQPVPVYPTFDADTNSVTEGFNGQRYKISGSINYSLAPAAQAAKGSVPFRLRVGLDLEWRRFVKDTTLVNQQLVSPFGNIELETGALAINGSLQTRVSNTFAPELDAKASAIFRPYSPGITYRLDDKRFAKEDSSGWLADSISRILDGPNFYPFEVKGQVLFRTINPSLFQSYFVGDSGNLYVPNVDLVNQTVLHGHAGIQWNGRTQLGPRDTLLPNFLSINAFYSQISRQIDYGDSMQVLQAAAGDANLWAGIELNARLRFGRKFHFENRTVAQLNLSQFDGQSLTNFVQTQPAIYGKAALFFDSKTLTVAERMRLGLELHYFTDYRSYAFDEISGEFFPSRYVVTPYARLDAYAVLKLMRVYIFARVVHTTEGILTGGYYTTPFHPMLQRSITFGVNWLFFD